MFEILFAIAVVFIVLFGNIAKAMKKKPAAAAPWARVQNGAQRLQTWAAPQPMPPALQPAPIAPGQPYGFPGPGSQQYGPQFQGGPQYQGGPQFQGGAHWQGGIQWQPGVAMPFQTDPGRQPNNRVPSSQQDLDGRVRKLMDAGHEVGAVRLLCDEADLGIIEAQRYARSLVGLTPATSSDSADSAGEGAAERRTADSGIDPETREIGSAAFATSTFDLGEDEGWASGWTDKPEADDRTDMDELWRTVRGAGQPRSASSERADTDNSVFDSEIELD